MAWDDMVVHHQETSPHVPIVRTYGVLTSLPYLRSSRKTCFPPLLSAQFFSPPTDSLVRFPIPFPLIPLLSSAIITCLSKAAFFWGLCRYPTGHLHRVVLITGLPKMRHVGLIFFQVAPESFEFDH
ncbi:hypothetical protein SODALDRAFT_30744 [Sodiomyces alkalinus F11]|uniref:Uncharacterized protein n=1 Tax=Sodiomyces alkalinus (strain CBS 110278 / VKM F-3762 / F11) TaxID=1314773 RepID=A0A3N2Q8K0_SODAK|nr:hypothetical protein SODALDRAFT_30744 [Sodiomyces alkalinus F11]ROT43101.1 hypothetical protein SODALDRAFT_30744 [Sodiomyces alkalinus F11]